MGNIILDAKFYSVSVESYIVPEIRIRRELLKKKHSVD